MAVGNGRQFLEGLRDGRKVWLEGEWVPDVTTHPKLSRMAHTPAALDDLQQDPKLHDQMTFTSPTTGQPVALSFIIPENQEDLLRLPAGPVRALLQRGRGPAPPKALRHL